jgi:hypothetical protein
MTVRAATPPKSGRPRNDSYLGANNSQPSGNPTPIEGFRDDERLSLGALSFRAGVSTRGECSLTLSRARKVIMDVEVDLKRATVVSTTGCFDRKKEEKTAETLSEAHH